MKRILTLWLAAMLVAVQPCYAVVMVGFGQSAEFSCGTFEICDNFSNLSAWTQDQGTWTASSNAVTKTAGLHGILRHNTPLANYTRQFVLLKISSYTRNDTDDTPGIGVITRSNSSTGYRLGAYLYPLNSTIDLAQPNFYNWNTYIAADGSAQTSSDLVLAGSYIGFETEKTTGGNIRRFWRWSSNPGARSSWGAADATVNDSTEGINDTGLYVGILMMNISSSESTAISEFYAGSSATTF